MEDASKDLAGSASTGSGKARGGLARAQSLTSDQRRDIARQAAKTRWDAMRSNGVSQATHAGEIKIGDLNIPCAVLADGRRVLSQRGVGLALGRKHGGQDWKRRQAGGELPIFLGAENLKPFISEDLMLVASKPILYRNLKGGGVAHGIEAGVLPTICDVWLKARDAKALKAAQVPIAIKADILIRGLAHTGILALVDEATGYQEVRDRDALQQILDQYIGRELAKWAERFPKTFYEQMFRLKGWTYNPSSSKRPLQMARMTVDLVFDRIGPGLTKDLRVRRAEIQESTGKTGKLHQVLTKDVGHPALAHHLAGLEFAAKTFQNGDYEGFYRAVERAAPRYNRTLLLPFPDEDVNMPNEGPIQ
jgi:hypothetical protein